MPQLFDFRFESLQGARFEQRCPGADALNPNHAVWAFAAARRRVPVAEPTRLLRCIGRSSRIPRHRVALVFLNAARMEISIGTQASRNNE